MKEERNGTIEVKIIKRMEWVRVMAKGIVVFGGTGMDAANLFMPPSP